MGVYFTTAFLLSLWLGTEGGAKGGVVPVTLIYLWSAAGSNIFTDAILHLYASPIPTVGSVYWWVDKWTLGL